MSCTITFNTGYLTDHKLLWTTGIFLGLFGRGDKLKDYKYKGGAC